MIEDKNNTKIGLPEIMKFRRYALKSYGSDRAAFACWFLTVTWITRIIYGAGIS